MKLLSRLKKKEENKKGSFSTAPISEELLDSSLLILPDSPEPPQLIVGSAISVGKTRDHNEDSLFSLTANLASNGVSTLMGIYIVADGMGGHQNGEAASEAATRAMSTHLVKKIFHPHFRVDPEIPQESLQEIMQEGVKAAQKAVITNAPGGGTTLTAILILDNRMTIAHVGDSRAYAIYLDGRITPLTRDHSFVKRLEELGQITAEEAEVHPQRNVLIRALGQSDPFEPDIMTSPLPKPGYVLVCSDGLWGVVGEKELYDIVAESINPQKACQKMVDAANAAGGPDNITALLVRMPD